MVGVRAAPWSSPDTSVRPPLGVRLGSLPDDSQQDLRFVQERLALFAKVTFLITSTFLLVSSAADFLRGVSRMGPLGRASHVIGAAVALALWQVLRNPRSLKPRTLQLLDLLGTLGVCMSFASIGHHALQPYGFYTALLGVTHACVARAVIVPSMPHRTLLLALASFSAIVLSRSTLPLSIEMAQVPGSRGREIVEAISWAIAGSAVATVASKVIYGLHTKAREARQLGQYALEGKIGEGGMGEIYRARHAMLRRPTAIKLMSGHGSEAQLRRFEREVQLTARLTHPNTISIYDYGRTPDGIFYYAMELLEGLTLEELVDRYGPQPPARVIHILLQACGALREAHRVGLIHRDIKPANVFLCRRGDIPDFVKMLDFGLVRELTGGDPGDLSRSDAGTVVGTPLYLAPEAILDPDGIDARADIYGLGGLAYFLATGVPPFTGRNIVELCAHHLHTLPPPPSRHNAVPADLEQVILRCLAKDPDDRPESARALADALDRCRDARVWSEDEASRWWAGVEESASAQRRSGTSREPPQRTFFRVDLTSRADAAGEDR